MNKRYFNLDDLFADIQKMKLQDHSPIKLKDIPLKLSFKFYNQNNSWEFHGSAIMNYLDSLSSENKIKYSVFFKNIFIDKNEKYISIFLEYLNNNFVSLDDFIERSQSLLLLV